MKTFGRILLVIGVIFTVFTLARVLLSGHLANVDPFEINNANKLTFYWSPITAIAFLVSGAAILIIRKKEKRRAIHKYYRYYH